MMESLASRLLAFPQQRHFQMTMMSRRGSSSMVSIRSDDIGMRGRLQTHLQNLRWQQPDPQRCAFSSAAYLSLSSSSSLMICTRTTQQTQEDRRWLSQAPQKQRQEEEEQEISTTEQPERTFWSLQELSQIDRWDHPNIALIVDDIAYRLKYQSSLLDELSDYLVEIREDPLVATMPQTDHKSLPPPPPSNPITSNGSMSRPYWWTYEQESQMVQEIEKQQNEVRNLQRLYHDTYDKILQYRFSLSKKHGQKKPSQLQRQLLHKLFTEIYSRHALTIETFAEIVISLKPIQQPESMSTIVQTLLQERIGMLLLCDHITMISNNKPTSKSPIVKNDDIVDTISKAVTEAKHLCEAHYLTSPNVHIIEKNKAATHPTDETSSSFTSSDYYIVKPWLQYTLVELLKNSMSVTIVRNRNHCKSCNDILKDSPSSQLKETIPEDEDDQEHQMLCPIFVYVHETPTNIWIDIHDQGGGIMPSKKQRLFEFAQHTRKWDRMDDQQTYAMTRSPLQGLGVGLSMSKIQIEMFGGQLTVEDRGLSDLQPGVTATIVLPKDSTILEKLSSLS